MPKLFVGLFLSLCHLAGVALHSSGGEREREREGGRGRKRKGRGGGRKGGGVEGAERERREESRRENRRPKKGKLVECYFSFQQLFREL